MKKLYISPRIDCSQAFVKIPVYELESSGETDDYRVKQRFDETTESDGQAWGDGLQKSIW